MLFNIRVKTTTKEIKMNIRLIKEVSGTMAPPCEQLNCAHKIECAKGKACELFDKYINLQAGAKVDYKVRMRNHPQLLTSMMTPTEARYKKIFSE